MDGFQSDRAKRIVSHARIILVGCNNCYCKIGVILYSKTIGPISVYGTGTSHSDVSHIIGVGSTRD